MDYIISTGFMSLVNFIDLYCIFLNKLNKDVINIISKKLKSIILADNFNNCPFGDFDINFIRVNQRRYDFSHDRKRSLEKISSDIILCNDQSLKIIYPVCQYEKYDPEFKNNWHYKKISPPIEPRYPTDHYWARIRNQAESEGYDSREEDDYQFTFSLNETGVNLTDDSTDDSTDN